MPKHEKIVETIPIGPLGIIALGDELGNKVNDYLVYWRELEKVSTKALLHFQVIKETLT